MSCLHCIVQGEMYDFQTDRILTYYSDTGLICVVYKFSVAHFNDSVKLHLDLFLLFACVPYILYNTFLQSYIHVKASI